MVCSTGNPRTYPCLSRCRFLSNRQKAAQEEFDPEVCHGRAEEHGTLFTLQDAVRVERFYKPEAIGKSKVELMIRGSGSCAGTTSYLVADGNIPRRAVCTRGAVGP